MKPRHTPGPWAVSKVANDYEQYMVYAEGSPNGHNVASSVDGEANARLVAAAPDLLSALVSALDQMEQCERMFQDDVEFMAALCKVRETLAAAVGGHV